MIGRERIGIMTLVACSAMALLQAAPAFAEIDLDLRPPSTVAGLGEIVGIGLYAVSDDETNQLLSAAQVIIEWESAKLQLVGLSAAGAVPLLSSSFPAGDPFGLNEVVPPQDGDGIYVAWAPIANPVAATPEGVLLTTFQFLTIAPATASPVDIVASGGAPPTQTIVFDGTMANLNVTGLLGGAVVQVVSCCPADLDGDCEVGITDFLSLLAAWGTDPGGPPDLDDSGDVGIQDFLALLAAWGRCP